MRDEGCGRARCRAKLLCRLPLDREEPVLRPGKAEVLTQGRAFILFPEDAAPLPEIPETNASKSARERVIETARRDNLTVRQLAQRLGGYSGSKFLGTPKMIADQMEQWLVEEGSDGFNVMFPYLPGGLDDFVDKVVPELQRRGLFRTEYEGKTLRENLGLPRPENRFFAATAKAAE